MDDRDDVPFPGAFMVRAMGQPVATNTEEGADGCPSVVRVSPNPVSGPLRATVELTEPGTATADVVDALGETAVTLHEGPVSAGAQTFAASGDLAPGAYVVRVQTERGVTSARVVVVRRWTCGVDGGARLGFCRGYSPRPVPPIHGRPVSSRHATRFRRHPRP